MLGEVPSHHEPGEQEMSGAGGKIQKPNYTWAVGSSRKLREILDRSASHYPPANKYLTTAPYAGGHEQGDGYHKEEHIADTEMARPGTGRGVRLRVMHRERNGTS